MNYANIRYKKENAKNAIIKNVNADKGLILTMD